MEKVSLETIRLAQGGDETAFQEIYEQCYSHVFYYALNLSKNEADARDIAQETFLQVFRSIQDLKNPDYFPLWLNRIVYSKFSRVLSKQKETAIESTDLRYHLDQSEKAKAQNEKRLLNDEEVIQQMIASLSEKQRDVITLMYYKQLSVPEISKVLHLPEGTIKNRIFQGKKMLRKKIVEFEKVEGRKIELHSDVLLPVVGITLFTRLKSFFQTSSLQQATMIASTASLVVVSVAAVNETTHLAQANAQAKTDRQPVQTLPRKAFNPVPYQEEQIDTAKSAYFTLLSWAPNAGCVREKTLEEKAAVKSLVDELIDSDSTYLDQLQSKGWLAAYNE